MKDSTAEQWVRASYHAGGIGTRIEFTIAIQQLGLLNMRLCAEENRQAALTEQERSTEGEIMAYNHLLTTSWLWLLGCYEIVRSLHQHLGEITPKSDGYVDDYLEEVKRLKHELADLRMPLAKFEAHGRKELSLAWPAYSQTGEVAWTFDGMKFTTRRYLAQRFLGVLLFGR